MVYSRSLTGYNEFTDDERALFPPVSRSLVRIHPGSGQRHSAVGVARIAHRSGGRPNEAAHFSASSLKMPPDHNLSTGMIGSCTTW